MARSSSAQSPDAKSNVLLFTGEVDARRSAAVEKLIEQHIDPSFAAFDLEKFDGDSAASEDVLAAAATLPFGSPCKVVVVDRIDKMSPDGQARIAAFVPRLGPQSCLILLAGEGSSGKGAASAAPARDGQEADDQKAEKKPRKGLQPALSAAVKKHGSVVSFGKMKTDALTALIGQMVRASGKQIESSALQAMARTTQSSPSIIERELEKLFAYIGDRNTITAADVDLVVTKSAEDRVFPLIDAVAAGRPDTAIQLLEETLSAGVKADNEVMKVLSMLGRHFRLLYQTKFLMTQGVRYLGQVSDELKCMLMSELSPLKGSDWQQRKYLEQARLFTLEELRSCLKQVLLCELNVKGIGEQSGSPRLNLEMLVMRLSHRR